MKDNRLSSMQKINLPAWFTERGFEVVLRFIYGFRIDDEKMSLDLAKEVL
jgi:hypothetical protein